MRKPQRTEDADVDEGVVDYRIDRNPLLLLPIGGKEAEVKAIINHDPDLLEMAINDRFMEQDREDREMAAWNEWNDRHSPLDWDDADLAWRNSDDVEKAPHEEPEWYDYNYDY